MQKPSSILRHECAALLLASAVLLPAMPAVAATTAPNGPSPRAGVLAAATQAAAVYMAVAPEQVVLREPDARLQPPACPAGFSGRPAPGTGTTNRVTVEVSCRGMTWRTFVAARIEGPSAPATGGANPHSADNPSADGTRGVSGASPRNGPRARVVAAVRRGAPVTLTAGTSTFRVVTAGVALADAPLGAWVRVRNVATGKELEGKVIGEGQVVFTTPVQPLQGIPQVAAEAVDNSSVGQVARRGEEK